MVRQIIFRVHIKCSFAASHHCTKHMRPCHLPARDIMDASSFPTADDTAFLTVTRPKELGKPVVVDGAGLVAHFTFNKQKNPHNDRALRWSDLSLRYRDYVEGFICGFE